MGKRKGECRRRKTLNVTRARNNKINGRSQKGCFGGTSGFCASGMVFIKELKDSGKTVKRLLLEKEQI